MSETLDTAQDLFTYIGRKLRAAREANGLTLQEISARTRIHQGFLEKIEKGDMEGLPGLAFVKGFLRNYVQALELKDDELEEAMQRLVPQQRPVATHKMPGVNVLETEAPGFAWPKLVVWALLIILIGWVGYMLLRSPKTEHVAQTPATQAPAAQTPAAQPASGEQPATAQATTPAGTAAEQAAKAQQPAAKSEPAAAVTTSAKPAATPGEPGKRPAAAEPPAVAATSPVAPLTNQRLKLTIRGLERTWVRLSIDRAPPIDVVLEPADTVGWEANQEFRLTVGKSQGVAVYLNGEDIVLPQERNRLLSNIVLNKLTLLKLEN